jgi:hypothetical protein
MKRRNYLSLFIVATFLLLAFVVNSALAAPPERPNKPTKNTDRGVEWYVRLIAQSPADNLLDRNNVLGQLFDSVDGYDSHDLKELDPFATPYLTIVFPHEEWARPEDNYSSDYHAVKWQEPDHWVFQVKSDDIWRDVYLSWENVLVLNGDISGEELQDKMYLEDVDSGALIKIIENGVPVAGYPFNMDGEPVRTFRWILTGKEEKEKGGGKGHNK